jgi:16S rRNA (guanine966-N2)-methyltransferase
LSTPKKKSAPPNKGEQKLRIIGGRWRGRMLSFPDLDGLRPTGNRVRETLFNWLMPSLPNSRCLDLFAGSGALGFEAISRGALACTLVELAAPAARQLKANAELLNCSQAQIIQSSALNFLQTNPSQGFDIVFIDPPFAQELWLPVVDRLAPWLNDGALIYLETPKGTALHLPVNWQLHRQKEAGKVCFSLHRFETNSATNG